MSGAKKPPTAYFLFMDQHRAAAKAELVQADPAAKIGVAQVSILCLKPSSPTFSCNGTIATRHAWLQVAKALGAKWSALDEAGEYLQAALSSWTTQSCAAMPQLWCLKVKGQHLDLVRRLAAQSVADCLVHKAISRTEHCLQQAQLCVMGLQGGSPTRLQLWKRLKSCRLLLQQQPAQARLHTRMLLLAARKQWRALSQAAARAWMQQPASMQTPRRSQQLMQPKAGRFCTAC